MFKKVDREVSVLAIISSYVSFKKKRNRLKAFLESHFEYCPLYWMFHSTKVISKIKHIHERDLRKVYKDNISSIDGLLEKEYF